MASKPESALGMGSMFATWVGSEVDGVFVVVTYFFESARFVGPSYLLPLHNLHSKLTVKMQLYMLLCILFDLSETDSESNK